MTRWLTVAVEDGKEDAAKARIEKVPGVTAVRVLPAGLVPAPITGKG